MYVLEGKISFYYEGKKYSLRKDCIYLDSGVPHRSENIGKKPAKTLTVIYTRYGKKGCRHVEVVTLHTVNMFA
jgi:mannose-6-phosphate isomerase-like protein (cupin superfamily)